MMPVVRGVIMRQTAAGSRLCVAGSMSAKIGVISCHCSACAVAMNVYDGTMTSPFKSSARVAISSAIVPLHIATQCLTPRNVGDSPFEFLRDRSIVGQPAAVQDVGRALQKALVIADVGPADVQAARRTSAARR